MRIVADPDQFGCLSWFSLRLAADADMHGQECLSDNNAVAAPVRATCGDQCPRTLSGQEKCEIVSKNASRRMTPTRPADARLPSLDGWRSVAIALVILSHRGYTRGFP